MLSYSSLSRYTCVAGILLLMASVVAVLMLCYPYTMGSLEATDFFVWTSDYLRMKLAEKPGITAFLTDFLLQFFRWQGVGAVIVAVVLGLSACGFMAAQHVAGRVAACKYRFPLGVLLSALVFWAAPFQLHLHLETLFFSWLLCLLLVCRRFWTGLLWLLLAPFFLSWLFQVVLWTIVVAFAAYYRLWTVRASVVRLLCGWVVSTLMVYALSDWVGFIPLESRWMPSSVNSLFLFFYFLLAAAVLVGVPVGGRRKGSESADLHKEGRHHIVSFVLAVLMCFVAVALPVSTTRKEDLKRQEQVYCLAYLADHSQWQKLLETCSSEDVEHNRMTQTYAILAEWMTGALPRNVLNYYVNGSEDLLLRDNAKYDCRNFNRCFYENIGMYDEAFRHAYEMGIKCRNGMGFSAMRHMARYAVHSGNIPVACQCLDQLSRSVSHWDWVRQWRMVLAAAPHREDIPVHDSLPMRNTRSFAGVYSLGFEMQEEYAHDSTNLLALDGALVAFLLDEQFVPFIKLLAGSGVYVDKPLPKIYAEAVAMIAAGETEEDGRRLRESFHYDMQYDWNYRQWQEMMASGSSDQRFRGSYWDYYVRRQRR